MDYLTTGDVAILLGCSKYHVKSLAEKKILAAHKMHQRGWTRIRRASVVQYAAGKGIELDFSRLAELGKSSLQLAG